MMSRHLLGSRGLGGTSEENIGKREQHMQRHSSGEYLEKYLYAIIVYVNISPSVGIPRKF